MLILATLAVFASALFLVRGLTAGARDVDVALGRARRYALRHGGGREDERGARERLLTPLVGRLAGATMRLAPRTSADAVRRRLLAAGLGRVVTPQAYLAAKGAGTGVPLVLGLGLLTLGVAPAIVGLAVAAGGAALGFIAPEFVLNSRIRSRRERMQAELPNVLDLLCVSVEAGLGFDQAVAKLTERMEGPLVDEFALALHEMRIGQTRAAALRNLADRVDAPEVSQFTRALIQADQLGIALSRILRVQAGDMRLRRQLAAEEKAMKAPVKMLFPTVLFIFPAMFVVVLGPAALNLASAFGTS
jgi:tight adherence protein C